MNYKKFQSILLISKQFILHLLIVIVNNIFTNRMDKQILKDFN